MQDDTYRKDVVLVTVALGVAIIFRSRVRHGKTWLMIYLRGLLPLTSG
jgi:hypothetical protein